MSSGVLKECIWHPKLSHPEPNVISPLSTHYVHYIPEVRGQIRTHHHHSKRLGVLILCRGWWSHFKDVDLQDPTLKAQAQELQL